MTYRVVLGPLPGGGYGLRVSVPGQDVLNSNLFPKHVAFDSRWGSAYKLLRSGQDVLPTGSFGNGVLTVEFETQSHYPLAIAYHKRSDGLYVTDGIGVTVAKNFIRIGGPTGTRVGWQVFTR
jgi:hypothetical protein